MTRIINALGLRLGISSHWVHDIVPDPYDKQIARDLIIRWYLCSYIQRAGGYMGSIVIRHHLSKISVQFSFFLTYYSLQRAYKIIKLQFLSHKKRARSYMCYDWKEYVEHFPFSPIISKGKICNSIYHFVFPHTFRVMLQTLLICTYTTILSEHTSTSSYSYVCAYTLLAKTFMLLVFIKRFWERKNEAQTRQFIYLCLLHYYKIFGIKNPKSFLSINISSHVLLFLLLQILLYELLKHQHFAKMKMRDINTNVLIDTSYIPSFTSRSTSPYQHTTRYINFRKFYNKRWVYIKRGFKRRKKLLDTLFRVNRILGDFSSFKYCLEHRLLKCNKCWVTLLPFNYFTALKLNGVLYFNNKKVLFNVGGRFRQFRFAKDFITLFNMGTMFCDITSVVNQIAYGPANVGRHHSFSLKKFVHTMITMMELYYPSILGLKVLINGKIGGRTRTKQLRLPLPIPVRYQHSRSWAVTPKIPLQSININVDYMFSHAHTYTGVFGIHLWYYYREPTLPEYIVQ